jgi:hypothetical protein
MDACPLFAWLAGIISGAVGRTDGFASLGGGAAGAAALVAGGVAGAVGGPIEIAGIAGRCLPVAGPMSIGRVTTTAGPPAATGAVTTTAGAAAAGAAAGIGGGTTGDAAAGAALFAAAWFAPSVFAALACGDAGDPPFDDDACADGARCCADFADGEAPFCEAGLGVGCAGGAPALPSFGGRCIDEASSAVFVEDVASVSLLGLPEKSLEKTLIAEHQP